MKWYITLVCEDMNIINNLKHKIIKGWKHNRAEKCQKPGSQTLGERKLDSSVSGCTREQ